MMTHDMPPRCRATSAIVLGLLAVCVSLTSCSVGSRHAGVDNLWRDAAAVSGFEEGVTTMDEIMEQLGPPSQMVDLLDGPMLYYLLEQSDTSSLFLAVYNSQTIRVRYDRAVFLCDREGVLRHMAMSKEVIEDETD